MIEYIFCINTGRTGSAYLSKLFSCVENVKSCHESPPILNREPMIDFLNNRPEKLREAMSEKILAIKSQKGNFDVYCDTSHVFIKSFGWMIPEYLDTKKIGIVVLKRDESKIVESLTRIQCNAFNYEGSGWLMHLTKKGKITPLPNIRFALLTYYCYRIILRFYKYVVDHDISILMKLFSFDKFKEPRIPKKLNNKLLRWYVKETYAMGNGYLMKYPEIRSFHTKLESLNDPKEVFKMFEFFGLTKIDVMKIKKTLGVVVNDRL